MGQTTNHNVNRRFTNELKKALAGHAQARRRWLAAPKFSGGETGADDETTRKETWLT